MFQAKQAAYIKLPRHEKIGYDRKGKTLGINCIINSELSQNFPSGLDM